MQQTSYRKILAVSFFPRLAVLELAAMTSLKRTEKAELANIEKRYGLRWDELHGCARRKPGLACTEQRRSQDQYQASRVADISGPFPPGIRHF